MKNQRITDTIVCVFQFSITPLSITRQSQVCVESLCKNLRKLKTDFSKVQSKTNLLNSIFI